MENSANPAPAELCPFCGKPFKRLKSHLPYCKANRPVDDSSKHGATQVQPAGKKTKPKKSALTDQGTEEGGKIKKGATKEKGTTKKILKDGEESNMANVKRMKATTTDKRMPRELGPQQISVTREGHGRSNLEQRLVGQSIRDATAPSVNGPNVKLKLLRKQETVAELAVPILLHFPDNMEPKANVSTHLERKGVVRTQQSHPVWHQPAGKALTVDVSEPATLPVMETMPQEADRQKAGKTLVWEHITFPLSGKRWQLCTELHPLETEVSHLTAPRTPVSIFPLDNVSKQGIFSTTGAQSDSKTGHSSKKSILDSTPRVQSPSSQSLRNMQYVDSLGFQWIPELYQNYLSLHLIQENSDQWVSETRVTEAELPTGDQPDVPLAMRRLMDTRLGELPSWVTQHRISAKTFPAAVQQGWGRYYQKYINVRRGGVGGLTMLLAGYCVLSYVWNYDHIKHDRWRKYH
ncbi:mitochondrial nucleoid-associated protein 1 [Discoglossus pictus]